MRSPHLVASVCLVLGIALCGPELSFGQYSISSVAGGGPNNLTALKSSVGYAESVARDSAGNTYIADSYSSQIFKVDTNGNLTVVAGNGTVGYTGDGGPATSAALNKPESVVVDASGNIFIADTDNFVIREVVASSGNIQTVAGNGIEGYSGDGSPATKAQLTDPYGVFVDASGNVFIADTDNFIIRCVAPVAAGCGISTSQAGYIYSVAGTPGVSGYAGDGGPATSAELDEPEGVFVDASGNIFIADTFNSVIREVTITNGDIETVAGTYYAWSDNCQYGGDGGPATSAQLCLPSGVFLDGPGDIFIADTSNSRIREVVTGTINTVAGDGTAGYTGDGGPATSAELNYPSDMVVDGSGDIFIADTDNFLIREVSSGTINKIIGNNTIAYSGDGSPALEASLNAPGQTFVDAAGNIFIADTDSSVIREVVALSGDIETVAGNGAACDIATNPTCGDGGPATSAELNFPGGFFLDTAGDVYTADTENSVIRVVNTSASPITIAGVVIQPGDIETVAGTLGTTGYSGDGGPPTSAQLNNPYSVLLDGSGNIYIADTTNSAIRVVNTGTTQITIAGILIQPGTIQTVAGNGTPCADPSTGCGDNGPATSAELNFPGGLALDTAGDIFIADTFNNAVREVNASTGIITTVAGTLGQRGYSGDNGPPTSALLDTPSGVFVDSLGNIFIADTDNSAIREVVAVTDTIQTIAGNGTAGFSGDNGTATSAQLDTPLGIFGVASGTLFIADTENFRIRQLSSKMEVAIEPHSATLPIKGSQQFIAPVSGANNTSVTWQVNGVTGGNSTWGTILSNGLYQAPSNLPSGSAATVTAISDANGFTSASVQVKLAAKGVPTVTVSTSPAGVTDIYTGTTQSFTASVTAEANSAVNWQVEGIAGGNPTVGTISSAGVYTAPASVPSRPFILISAISQANPAVSGFYPFTIFNEPSAAQPAPQTISPGGVANYSLALNANTGDPKQPITLSCLQSSLPPGASCTFTPTKITPGKESVPFALAVNVPTGTASLPKPGSLWLATQVCFGFTPIVGILLIGGKSKQRKRWLYLVLLGVLMLALNACGGGGGSSSSGGTTGTQNPETGTYTIQIQGTTPAQPNTFTITSAGLTVQ